MCNGFCWNFAVKKAIDTGERVIYNTINRSFLNAR